MSLLLEKIRSDRILAAQAEEDYDFIFGKGAYGRMLCAQREGCIVVIDEREELERPGM